MRNLFNKKGSIDILSSKKYSKRDIIRGCIAFSAGIILGLLVTPFKIGNNGNHTDNRRIINNFFGADDELKIRAALDGNVSDKSESESECDAVNADSSSLDSTSSSEDTSDTISE